MSIIYTTATKTARLQAVIDTIDAHVNPARLEIGTTGMGTILATIELTDPCGTVSGTELTFTPGQSDVDADNTGTAAEARIVTGGGVDVITGLTVALSNADIAIDSLSITAGQQVTVATSVINHA